MRNQKGFTLIEAITAIAVFAVLVAGVLGLFSVLSRASKTAREQTILSALSAAKLEIMRNLPYASVGTVSGNPNGVLPDFTAPDALTYSGVDYEIYYEVTYIDDPADGTILAGTDTAANDYKQIKMYIENTLTGKVTSFVTNVSPKGLEGLVNAGALWVDVMDANGQPVANATVTIANPDLTPPISLSRQTDASGHWIEVGLPPAVNGYQITATKAGYSSDGTVPITVANPNPVKPHATIVINTVTQISFAIDLVANLNILTLNATCSALNGINVDVLGSKLIGSSPDVLKYNQTHSSSGGSINLSNIEWDLYLPALVGGQGYTLYGSSPIQEVNVLPGASQTFSLILGAATSDSLLVIVKNATTGAPIENALVNLSRVSPAYNEDKYTGGSVWNQNNWSAGPGQADFVINSQYFSDDGNVDTISGHVQLANIGSSYVPSGQLVSSTFDTGGSSNYTTLEWEPTSQNPATSIKIQVASNNDNSTWDYVGPDGTDTSFYTVPGTSLSAVHAGDRYIRYRVILETTDTSFTPNLTNININYVSGCNTPGQVFYPNLSPSNDYDLNVSMVGFTNYSVSGLNISGNQMLEILMVP